MKRYPVCFRNAVLMTVLAVTGTHAQTSPSPSAGTPPSTAPASSLGTPSGVAGSGVTEPSSNGSSRAIGHAGYDSGRGKDQNLGWIGILGVIGLGGLLRPRRDRVNSPGDQ